ncbi:MAG: 3-dehydroquinate synthase, partial [bacterium]
MKTVRVRLGERSYSIAIGAGALSRLGRAARAHFPGGRALVVTDRNVGRLLGPRALRALAGAGVEAALFAVPAGERSKSAGALGRIYDRLAALRMDR